MTLGRGCARTPLCSWNHGTGRKKASWLPFHEGSETEFEDVLDELDQRFNVCAVCRPDAYIKNLKQDKEDNTVYED